MWIDLMKRLFDIAISGALLVILAPLFLIIGLLVIIILGTPVLFVQDRPGLNGVPFRMYKFRTMLNAYDSNGVALEDCLRLTRFGRFLRSTSLDELPELWNVLVGHMSLVGPRPLLIEYLPLYSKEQMRRHDVRPGITGLAQVNGRNAIGWSERFNIDVWYVDNASLWLDLKILARTIGKVLARDGVSKVGEATMSKFTGK
jgi:lipopolysaccharide/colanic/teichoic acid biosynthesis glycosyltransferase